MGKITNEYYRVKYPLKFDFFYNQFFQKIIQINIIKLK